MLSSVPQFCKPYLPDMVDLLPVEELIDFNPFNNAVFKEHRAACLRHYLREGSALSRRLA